MTVHKPRALGTCQRTGFKVPADELVEDEETGALVWEPYWEPRHPSRDMPPPRGQRVHENATGPDQDYHLSPGEVTRDDL